MFDNIILWLGDDIRARQAALQFAKKLNLKRCYMVRKSTDFAPDTPFTPLNLLNEGIHLGGILESALKLRHDKIMTFWDIRNEVWYELYHSDKIEGLKWERYPDLTKLLKGYRRGELSIYTGQTGSGKTTLLSELSLDLCMQNVCTLWGSFEISTIRLAKTMLRQYSRVNLEENNELFEIWADKYESLPMYFMNFYGATKIEDIIETIDYAVYMYDVEHVIVDNLQFMVSLEFQNDKYFVQDKIVAALRRFATEKAVHISLVVHPRKENDEVVLEKSSIYGTAKAIQEADNIMILHSNPGQAKALEVCKNRFDGTLGLVRLQYSTSDSTFSNLKSSRSNIIAMMNQEKW
ncbi:hypothetical protein LOD99_2724 [Oopsacas minuta]|uniref:SF4 helicase domain-containing protein n=1 Tax=Oopsacas minuta TaxID=111878 RepID=A0AAV7K253_9METZ|nr:hypothetical protein LOD99_2724 [Oopsacas minuta]